MPKIKPVKHKHDYRYLVFSGAGAAYPAYAGAFKALCKQPEFSIDKITGIIGTSVGAIAALMVSLNFTPEEIEEKLLGIKMTELTGKANLSRLVTHYGVYKWDKIYNIVLNIVKEKFPDMDPKNVSFNDLKEAGFKDLYISTTKMYIINDEPVGKEIVFSHQKSANTSIVTAAIASAAASPGFEALPLKKFKKDNKYRLVSKPDETTDPFTDGGLLNNYPIRFFDKPEFLDADTAKEHANINEIYNPYVLGLTPITDELMVGSEHAPVKEHMGFYNPRAFYTGLVRTLTKNWQYQNMHVPGVAERTIEIERDISTFDFKGSEETLDKQMKYGKEAVIKFFNTKSTDTQNPDSSPYEEDDSGEYQPARKNKCIPGCQLL